MVCDIQCHAAGHAGEGGLMSAFPIVSFIRGFSPPKHMHLIAHAAHIRVDAVRDDDQHSECQSLQPLHIDPTQRSCVGPQA